MNPMRAVFVILVFNYFPLHVAAETPPASAERAGSEAQLASLTDPRISLAKTSADMRSDEIMRSMNPELAKKFAAISEILADKTKSVIQKKSEIIAVKKQYAARMGAQLDAEMKAPRSKKRSKR